MTEAWLTRNVCCNRARQEARNEGNLLVSIATFCLECIYSLVEYLTKFATVRMAITGEAFFDAARRATDLLTRNFLKVRLANLSHSLCTCAYTLCMLYKPCAVSSKPARLL